MPGLKPRPAGLRKNDIDLPPVFLRGRALLGPVWRVVELIGYLRRPETAQMAVEQIALHRLAQSSGSAGAVDFPAGREDGRTPEGNVRALRLLWHTRRQRDNVAGFVGAPGLKTGVS